MHAGAFVFMMIEQEATEKQIDENKIRMEILKNITTTKYNMTDQQFNKLIDALKPSLCSNLPEWSYEHANSFTLQLLTTIGRYTLSASIFSSVMISFLNIEALKFTSGRIKFILRTTRLLG